MESEADTRATSKSFTTAANANPCAPISAWQRSRSICKSLTTRPCANEGLECSGFVTKAWTCPRHELQAYAHKAHSQRSWVATFSAHAESLEESSPIMPLLCSKPIQPILTKISTPQHPPPEQHLHTNNRHTQSQESCALVALSAHGLSTVQTNIRHRIGQRVARTDAWEPTCWL